MRHKIFAKTFFAACLATTCLGSTMSHAEEPALYFYPKHEWTVEQVQTQGNKGLATCTVSNQLNNGYIVQIAGTKNGFTNINIDFRQDSFTENLKYEAQFSVPGVTQELIPTKAFKKNLLVSDLRKKNEFSEALKSAGVLDVTIRGNEFRMYMTGLDTAMGDYTKCTDGISGTASVIQENEEKAIAAANNTGAYAPPPPFPSQAAKSDNPENTQTAEEEYSNAKGTPGYAELLAQKLKEDSERYKAANNDAAPDAPKEKNITHSSYSSPKVKYTVSKNEKPMVADMTSGTPQIIEAEDGATATEIAQKLSSVEPVAGAAAYGAEYQAMQENMETLKGQVSLLRQKNQKLDEQLKLALTDSNIEKIAVSSNNWDLERATLKYNEAERQVTRLGRQLQTYRAQCDKEKSSLERMLFDPELTNQQQIAKLASLEAALDEAQIKLIRQQRQYEERLKILQSQLAGH